MRCLLCHGGLGPLQRVSDDLWEMSCRCCGAYRFDGAFAEVVKRARARNDGIMLQSCRQLAGEVQASETVLTIRYDTHGFAASGSA